MCVFPLPIVMGDMRLGVFFFDDDELYPGTIPIYKRRVDERKIMYSTMYYYLCVYRVFGISSLHKNITETTSKTYVIPTIIVTRNFDHPICNMRVDRSCCI